MVSVIANPRIEQAIGDVDQQVEDDHEHGDEDDGAHDDEIAAIGDRIAVMAAGRILGLEDVRPGPGPEGRTQAEINALARAALDAGLSPRVSD